MTTLVRTDVLLARITIIEDFFEGERMTVEVPVWDSHVGDVLPARVGPEWTLVLDGAVCDRQTRLNPGSHLICYRVPHDPATGAAWLMFGMMLFSIGVTMYEQISFKYPNLPVSPDRGINEDSSPTYGFEGIQNTMHEIAVLPVVYGEHRVGGQFLEVFIRAGAALPDVVAASGTVSMEFQPDHWYYFLNPETTEYRDWPPQLVHGTNTQFLTQVQPNQIIQLGPVQFMVSKVTSDILMEGWDITRNYDTRTLTDLPWNVVRATPAGRSDIFYALIAMSEGPIDGIRDIEINNQPITSYRGVSVESALGLNTQSAPAMFGDVTTDTVEADSAIGIDWLTYQTTRDNITAFEINIVAQGGLYALTDAAGITWASVTFEVEYKLVSSGTWIPREVTTISDARRTAVRAAIRQEGLPSGKYDIRIRRTVLEATANARMIDAFRRTSVNEIINDAHTYPNVGWLAISIVATDQLSGARPTITAIVKGRKVRKFTTATVYTVAWSDNPAWCVLDLLLSTRFGGGQFIAPVATKIGTITLTQDSATVLGNGTDWDGKVQPGMKLWDDTQGVVLTIASVEDDTHLTITPAWAGSTVSGHAYEIRRHDIDTASFVAWADYCDELVDNGAGGTEKRATLNIVLDSRGSGLWDTVTKMCAAGFGMVIKAGNWVKAKYEAAEPAVQLFTMANIAEGSFVEHFLALRERSNYFELQYLDQANNFQQAVEAWQDPLIFTNEESERRMTINVYGCTRQSQARRTSLRYAKANRFQTRTIEFSAGLDAVICEPGDVINFQHDVPQWGWGSRVTTLAPEEPVETAITLDQAMTVVGGNTYQIMIQHADGTLETRTVSDSPGTYTTLHVTQAWTTTPAVDEVVAFGKTNILVKPFRVLSLRRLPSMDVNLTCIEYDANVYDESNLGNVQPTQYSDLTVPNPNAAPAHVRDVAVRPLYDGTVLLLTFTPPSDLKYATAYIYRDQQGVLSKIGECPGGTIELRGFQFGEVVVLRVVSVSRTGVLADVLTAPTVMVLIRVQSLPPNVTGLELVDQANGVEFTGRDAKFRWRDRSRISGIGNELLGYEQLGIGAGGSDPHFRDYRVEIYDSTGVTFRRRAFVVDPAFTYTYEMNAEDGVVRSFQIKVWQRDIYNQISEVPAVLTVSNPAPPVPNNLRVVAAFNAVLVAHDPTLAIDRDGYMIWLSTGSGFTPNASTLVYQGHDTYHAIQCAGGVPVYVRLAALDTFGVDGVVYSSEYSATPLAFGDIIGELPAGSITETQIADDSISTPKLRANSVTADKVTTGQLITLAAQIADAVISSAHIYDLDAAKIRAGSITADKIALTLWGDLSQAIAYASDLLSGQPDHRLLYTAAQVDQGFYVNCRRDVGQPRPVVALATIRQWDDGYGAWWDTPSQGWDEPVTMNQGAWTTAPYDLGVASTGKVELWVEWITENPATAVLTVKAQYQAQGSTQWGTNYPDYNNALFEILADLGTQGGVRTRYVSSINAAVRKVKCTLEMRTNATVDRISFADPELRFNDTRVQADKLNLLTAATATAGGGQTLPATVLGYFKMELPDGTPVRVPYYSV